MFSEGQLPSEMFSDCQFMTGLISVLWRERGGGKLLRVCQQQRCKSSSLIRPGQHFLIKSRAKYGTKGFCLLLSGLKENLILPTSPTGNLIVLFWMWQAERSSNHLTSIILKRHFLLQVLSMECFSDWHAKCIPWVCETFSVACQVAAPPLDLKNCAKCHAYLQK